jgi:ATP-grasp domain.
MNHETNILVLSCGTRNKIIQYFKRELKGSGKVIAADCSELAPALYEADKYYIVPKIDITNYLDVILSICKENRIKAVFSLIDPELSILAKNKNAFFEIGTIPIISDYDGVEICFDKYRMYQFLIQNGFKTPKSYIEKDAFYQDLYYGKIQFPVILKPVKGSASMNIQKVDTEEELEFIWNRFAHMMIQEYMRGEEIGADVYVDLISREPVAIFAKKKLKMRAGETDKSISIKDATLFQIIIELVQKLGLIGVIDIDLFKVNGEYFISEVNPRFGGGYPHAFECGVNIPEMIINNLWGMKNKNAIGRYAEGIQMLKYSEIKIVKSVNSLKILKV